MQLWDVGCQRQVQLQGPDAGLLAQLLTPRDLRNARIGQCLYAPMIDESGGMLNDPIILKLAQDHFWFSIADADMLLWARAFALHFVQSLYLTILTIYLNLAFQCILEIS